MARKRSSKPGSPRQTAQQIAKDRRNFAKYSDEKHALRAQVAKGAGPAMKKLMALSIEDEQNMTTTLDGYKELSTLRRAAFREHARAMKISPDVAALIAEFAKRFGPKVKVWHNVVDWTVAVLIARYGEAPEHWPKEFSGDDARRMRLILSARYPLFKSATPLGVEIASSPAKMRALHRETQGPNGESPILLLGADEPSFDEE